MKIEKPEKVAGYILLIIGLILIIIAACLVLSIFLGGTHIPQLVPVPTAETSESIKSMIIFSNVCLIFFIFIIIVWAGSIISSRGVALTKEVTFKVTRESLGEGIEIAKEEKTEKS